MGARDTVPTHTAVCRRYLLARPGSGNAVAEAMREWREAVVDKE